MQEVANTVQEYIQLNFGMADDLIDQYTPFSAIEAIDSVAMLELILFIEEQFGVSIDDTDVTTDNFGSVQDVAAYLQRHGIGG